MSVAYRPSHADATYDMKYGIRVVEVISFVLYLNIILILLRLLVIRYTSSIFFF